MHKAKATKSRINQQEAEKPRSQKRNKKSKKYPWKMTLKGDNDAHQQLATPRVTNTQTQTNVNAQRGTQTKLAAEGEVEAAAENRSGHANKQARTHAAQLSTARRSPGCKHNQSANSILSIKLQNAACVSRQTARRQVPSNSLLPEP